MPAKRILLPLGLFLLISSASPAWGQEAVDPAMKEALSTLSQSVSNVGILASCICQLQAALWGGYDVTVGVGPNATRDESYRFFSISNGKFLTVEPTVADIFSETILMKFNRRGTIALASAEKAFEKGLPFFISEVQPEGPGSVSFKVISNRKTQIERAFQRIEENANGMHTELVRVPEPFSSKPDPQIRHASFTPLKPEDQGDQLLSVVVLSGGTYCPVSNEINLREITKKAAETK